MSDKKKILIADDDRILTHLVSSDLRSKGWAVEVANDSMQAFMFAVRSQPAAIVLDIHMPGGNGLDVLARLQRSSRTQQIPVVVVSGSWSHDEPGLVLELGASAFLEKPADPSLLHETLTRLAA